MNRREILQGLTGLSLAGASGCGKRIPKGEWEPIRVAVSPYISSSPFYLAQEQDAFQKAGLRVESHQIAGSSQAIPLLAGGKMDAALFSIGPAMVNAVARGAALRIVAAREIAAAGCGTLVLFARRDVFGKRPPDVRALKGRRVACSGKANVGEFALDAFLGNAGLGAEDVEFVALPRAEMVTAVVGGAVDAILTDAVAAHAAMRRSELVTLAELGTARPGFQFSFLFFGKRLIEGDIEPGRRFVSALLEANRSYLGGATPEFVRTLARESGLDLETVVGGCRPAMSADGAVRLADVQEFVDWSVRKRYSTERIEAARMVDERFLGRPGRMRGE